MTVGPIPRKTLGNRPSKQQGSFPGVFLGTRAEAGLAHFLATTTMIVACPILVGASEEGPRYDQRDRGGSRQEQVGEQMLHFGDR